MASKQARPLVTGAILVIVFSLLAILLPRFMSPEAGQVATFLSVFLAVLLAFIFFGVVFVSRALSGKISQRVYNLIEAIIIGGILLGVVGMFQPWVQIGYLGGFLVLLVSTLAFISWTHVMPRRTQREEEIASVSIIEVERRG